jgi:uncharacterized repeat protein (TIGR01451 family)
MPVLLLFLALTLVSGASAQAVVVPGCPSCTGVSLASAPVGAVVQPVGNTTTTLASTGQGKYMMALFPVTGSNPIPLPAGLAGGMYTAWCGTRQGDQTLGTPVIFNANSTPPAAGTIAPGKLSQQIIWNEINYVLNHKQFVLNGQQATVEDIQAAIWKLLNTLLTVESQNQPTGVALAADAVANGANFTPQPGGTTMVLLQYPSRTGFQHMIIEVPLCGSLGDRVWMDANGDGLQNAQQQTIADANTLAAYFNLSYDGVNFHGWKFPDSEAGIDGVQVELKDALGLQHLAYATTGTVPYGYPYLPQGTHGWYQFTGLCPGSYTAVVPNYSGANVQASLAGTSPTTIHAQNGAYAGNDSGNPDGEKGTVAIGTPAESLDFGFTGIPPLQATCAAASGQINVPYSSQIKLSGGMSPFTYSISAGALPDGLTLNASTGAITGLPTKTGVFSFTVKVVDARNTSAGTTTINCTITITSGALAVACPSTSGQAGVAYHSALVASGGLSPYTYSITTGALPAGLTLNADGSIDGTPTGLSNAQFTAAVTDSSGLTDNTAVAGCNIVVGAGPAQLKVVKSPKGGAFNMGDPVSFTIVVSNPAVAGSKAAANVTLTDGLPTNGGLTWTASTASQGTCGITNNTLSCSLGAIAAGASATVTVSSPATTPTGACTAQPNPAANVSADGGLSANDSGSLTCTPPPAQLKVVKTPKGGTFNMGDAVTYTIVVSNPAIAGSQPATNVSLTDTLPTNGGLTWTSSTTTQGTCTITGAVLSCSLGTIAAQASATVTVSSPASTPAAACQSQPNPAANVTADGSLTATDSGSLTCTPPPAQLKVVKTPKGGTFNMGDAVTYTIVVSNPAIAGSKAATNVSLSDTLPTNGGLTWTSSTASQGTCTITGAVLNCSLGTIGAQASATITVSSPATTPTAACQSQPNPSANVTADGGLTATDSGSLTCTPPPAQLKVVKTPKGGTFNMGDAVTYTIVVSNPAIAGSQSATNVMLADALPTNGGLTWASSTASQGTCSVTNNVLTCSLGTIAAQASATITVSSPAATPTAACQVQPNPAANATADGGLTATDAGSLSCTPPPAQLKVVKTPKGGTFNMGDAVTYTIVVSNPAVAGSKAATNVSLSDTLPTNGGLTWTSSTASQGTCSITGAVLNCSLGSIAPQSSVTITVSSPATPTAACQAQPNPAANVSADGGLAATDSGSLNCTPPVAQLSVVKSPKGGTFTMGAPVSFTIVVSNPAIAGSQAATNVKLNDTLPVNGGLTWTAATATQGSCGISGSLLNCSLGSLAAGASATIIVSSPATTPASACQSQPNPTANVTADGPRRN